MRDPHSEGAFSREKLNNRIGKKVSLPEKMYVYAVGYAMLFHNRLDGYCHLVPLFMGKTPLSTRAGDTRDRVK